MHVGYEALLMNDFPAQRRKLVALFRRQSGAYIGFVFGG